MGVDIPKLDRNKKWDFNPTLKVGSKVSGGDILGEVKETLTVTHKVMVPHNVKGTLKTLSKGKFTIDEAIGVVVLDNGSEVKLKMLQHWPDKNAPFKKDKPKEPMVTGQRIIDTLFPIAIQIAAIPDRLDQVNSCTTSVS